MDSRQALPYMVDFGHVCLWVDRVQRDLDTIYRFNALPNKNLCAALPLCERSIR